MNFRNELNEKQYEAVTTYNQYVRVVAGAGSGKTRVLTYRIAYLLSEMAALPWSILAITFTNKAAREMKSRINVLCPESEKDLQIKTFHSFAAYFLRKEISILGYPAHFAILDEEDQTKIIKDIASSMGYKKSDKIVGKALNYIGYQKLHERYPEDVKIERLAFEDERTCLEIYERYEEEKNKTFALDFDDLLLKTNYILENYKDVKRRWANRYQYILVDEFQDTNDTQYKLIKHFMAPATNLYVVGDPDQTIYTWRGANQKIIIDLSHEFPMIQTITLERNYRSTQNILDSANKLISYNKLRLKKNLYTQNNPGKPVLVRSTNSGKSEADFVAREIEKLVQVDGYSYNDIAILYRSNYITMDFESALMSKQIPYQIFGGLKFYQRAEIKDVLAYFHLVISKSNNIAFDRIINTPRRAVSDKTALLLKEEADRNSMSLYEYVESDLIENSEISKKAINSLRTMVTQINFARNEIEKNEEVFSKILEDLIWSIGYFEHLQKLDDADDRIDNVKALFSDIRQFLKSNPDSTFSEYLQNVSLLSGQDEVIEGKFVNLMTVHTAKGLEFPVVFIVRFNNGVFPSNRAIIEGGFEAMEEERRLAYVALTRAKERLYLTCAGDYSYVLGGTLSPSQFFVESGNQLKNNLEDLYNYNRSKSTIKKNTTIHFNDGKNQSFEPDVPKRQNLDIKTNGINEDDWAVGDVVEHRTLGRGVVVELEGDGIISVKFDNHGLKSIMGNHPAVSKGGHKA
jgi:DNA helicase-2/ATP-dependent DNA helicase PcrA